MATLTGQRIKDTYDGLLKTTDSTQGIPPTGTTVIEDGLGNDSSLALGQSGNGANVTGDLNVSGDVQTGKIDAENEQLDIVTTDEIQLEAEGITADANDSITLICNDINLQGKTGDTLGNTYIRNELRVEQISNISGNQQDQIQVESEVNFTENVFSDGTGTFQSGLVTAGKVEAQGDVETEGNLEADGDLVVQQNGEIYENFYLLGGASRFGIRTNNPSSAFHCVGSANITSLVNIGNGRLQTVGYNQGTKFGNYGNVTGSSSSGNIPSDTMKKNSTSNPPTRWVPKYSLAVGDDGFIVEDWKYYTIEIPPTAWKENQGGTGWSSVNLFGFTITANDIIVIDSVQYLRDAPIFPSQPNYPPVRGGYGGTDDEPYLYISTGQLDTAQIWNMSLRDYRTNSGKYITNKPLKYDLITNNQSLTFRAGAVPQLFMKKLNRPPQQSAQRPNYSVFLTIKFKSLPSNYFKANLDRTIN